MLWYSQAGTPVLNVKSHYDAKRKKLHLTVDAILPADAETKTQKTDAYSLRHWVAG